MQNQVKLRIKNLLLQITKISLFLFVVSSFAQITIAKDVKILWQKGKLFYEKVQPQQTKKQLQQWIVSTKKRFPQNQTFRVGNSFDFQKHLKQKTQKKPIQAKLSKEKKNSTLEKSKLPKGKKKHLRPFQKKDLSFLKKDQVVLRYSDNELVVLNKGTIFQRVVKKISHPLNPKKKTMVVTYHVQGTARFLLNQKANKQSYLFRINQTYFSTKKGNFFFQNISGKTIQVHEGQIQVLKSKNPIFVLKKVQPAKHPKKKKVTSKTPKFKKVALKKFPIILKNKQQLLLKGKDFFQQSIPKKNLIAQASRVVGFQNVGAYIYAGIAQAAKGKIQIQRYKKKLVFLDFEVPIFEKDKIITLKKDRTVLSLISEDRIRLSANTQFTIEKFHRKKKKRGFFEKLKFAFIGKIRAVIKPRKKKGLISFTAPTAVIGIKGTEFETTASAAATSVMGIHGVVGVKSPSGTGEVNVTPGTMTNVEKAKPPEKPKKIPPQLLAQLKKNGIPKQLIPQVTQIQITSPKKGKYLVKGTTLQFQVLPIGAPVDVLIDKKLVAKGQFPSFASLSDGRHEVTVQGKGKNPLSKTIQFLVDRKAPKLQPLQGINLQKIDLKKLVTVQFKWNEAISQANLKIEQLQAKQGQLKVSKTVGLALTGNKKSAPFPKSALQGLPEGKYQVTVIAKDQAGNQATSNFSFVIPKKSSQTKIATLPFQIKTKGFALKANSKGIYQFKGFSVPTIQIKTTQEIYLWKVIIGTKKTEIVKRENQKLIPQKKVNLEEKLFQGLKEGKHTIVVEGFGKQQKTLGKIQLEITLEQRPMIQVLSQGFTTKEGKLGIYQYKGGTVPQTIQLKANHSVQSWKIKLNKKEIATIQHQSNPTQKGLFSIPKKILANIKTGDSLVIIESYVGKKKKATLELTLQIHQNTLNVVIGKGKPLIRVFRFSDVTVKAEREIVEWKLFLNRKPLILPKEKTTTQQTKKQPKKELIIPKSVFQKLKFGEYQLRIEAIDKNKVKGVTRQKIVYHPETGISIVIGRGKAKANLSKNQDLVIKAGEEIKTWKVYLNNRFISPPQQKSSNVWGERGRSTQNNGAITYHQTIVISKSVFSSLSYGTHTLVIEVVGKSGMKGKAIQTLSFLPQRPPIITIGRNIGTLQANRVYQDLLVTSNRKLVEWQVYLNGAMVFNSLDKQRGRDQKATSSMWLKKANLRSVQEGKHNLQVKGIDEFGLKGSSQIVVLEKTPQSGPKLRVTQGMVSGKINQVGNIVISANRKIQSWSAKLNFRALQIKKWEIDSRKNELFLDKSHFKGLSNGNHKITIQAKDSFGKTAIVQMSFRIDRKVFGLALGAPNLSKLSIDQGGKIQIPFNQRLKGVTATRNGNTWKLNSSGSKLTINSKGLGFFPSIFKISVWDRKGKKIPFQGVIFPKVKRNDFLRYSFENSIAKDSKTTLDEIYLTNRSKLEISTVKNPWNAKSSQKLQFKIKQNQPLPKIHKMDDSFLRSFQ